METQQTQEAQAKLLYFLGELNHHWKRYDILIRGQTDLKGRQLEEALQKAETSYTYYELQLAKAGYLWHQLLYDPATKTFSLPERK